MSRGPAKSFDPDAALERAMDLFWDRGFQGAGLTELLQAMGIARKSLYDTYGNKRELFRKALAHYADRELGALEAELARPGSPLANVKRVLRRWQDANSGPRSRGCLLANNTAHFDADDEMAAALRTHFERLERAFTRALERARDAGELDGAASPRDLARLVVATAQGLALVCRTRDDGAFARGVVRGLLAALEGAD